MKTSSALAPKRLPGPPRRFGLPRRLAKGLAQSCALLGLLLGSAYAGPRASASYSIVTDTSDNGGGIASSTSYSMEVSSGNVDGLSTVSSPSEIERGGYIAQLFNVTAVHPSLPAGATTVTASTSVQLSASLLLDDGTTLPVAADTVTWSVGSGAITFISTGGLLSAATVYQNTAAVADASYFGASGTLDITVIPAPAPIIVLQQPAGTPLTNGVSTVSFGSVNYGASGTPVTFTILNNGTLNLTLSSVNTTGGNASDFVVNTASTSSPVASEGTTTFAVTFSPTAVGPESTTLAISNNDPVNGSFLIGLTGTSLPVPSGIVAIAGTPQTAALNLPFATALQARVTDVFGDPVSGAAVTFTVPGTGPSGTFATSAAAVMTNTSGIATAPVFTANGTNGSYAVTASVAGVATPATFALGNGSANPTAVQMGGTAVLNPQTGLFDLTVNVQNTTEAAINGFRLTVNYSSYVAAYPSLKLYNATNLATYPNVYVDYPYPVAVGATVPMNLEFYTSNRQFPNPFFPALSVTTLSTSEIPTPNPTGVPVSRIVTLANHTVLLEFPSTPGNWYRVSFSSNGMSAWYASQVPIQAGGTQTQWIDNGAPLTSSPPSSVSSRFYNVSQIPAP